jgi:hypothetical protein
LPIPLHIGHAAGKDMPRSQLISDFEWPVSGRASAPRVVVRSGDSETGSCPRLLPEHARRRIDTLPGVGDDDDDFDTRPTLTWIRTESPTPLPSRPRLFAMHDDVDPRIVEAYRRDAARLEHELLARRWRASPLGRILSFFVGVIAALVRVLVKDCPEPQMVLRAR